MVLRRDQWYYVLCRGPLAGLVWCPVALRDRGTGRIYSVVPWLDNDDVRLQEA